jgi:membrane protein DedA with SNARE-associated domain
VPGTLIVIAAGAFVRQEIFSPLLVTGWGLLGVMVGDCLSYAVGYFGGRWADRWFGQSPAWHNAQATFRRRGGLAIYLTRFLLTPLAVPTNLIAGGSGYPFWRFLAYDLAGELTWFALYGGLGYAFGAQWEAISQLASDFSGLLVGLAALLAAAYLLWQRHRRRGVRRTAQTQGVP